MNAGEPTDPLDEGETFPAAAADANCIGWLRQLRRNLGGAVRIALSRRTSADHFCATPGALLALTILDLLLNLLGSFLLVGERGSFISSGIPSFFFHLPLLLLMGYLGGRLLQLPSLLTIPVALAALSIPLELCHAVLEWIGQQSSFSWLEGYLEAPHYYRFYWWWSAASFLFLLRIKPAGPGRKAASLLLYLLLVLTPLWYFPRPDLWAAIPERGESGELQLTEEVLTAQADLLDRELAGVTRGKRGESDLYFVGFAGDGSQDVFLKELRATDRLLDSRFGAAGRSVIMANNPQTSTTLPFATISNLERALVRVGQLMNRDEDVLFVYLTSHGSKEHELAVNAPPLELKGLTPERLREILKRSGAKWKVIVVSACFSGGFIEPLKDDNTLIITAADAGHESFGCGFGENFTWFGEAFVNQALRQTYSFVEAFENAREIIRKWEEEEGETPSNPQIWVGKEILPKLKEIEKRLRAKG